MTEPLLPYYCLQVWFYFLEPWLVMRLRYAGRWFENSLPKPSTSLRQSRCNSQATPNQLISWAPAACIRAHAACRVVRLNVPDASVTTNTSNPSSNADSAGNATHTSVTTPARINC